MKGFPVWTMVVCLSVVFGISVADALEPTSSVEGLKAEVEGAAERHPGIVMSRGGEYPNTDVGNYVAAIGRHLIEGTGRYDDFVFHFTILRSRSPFAFSIAGGYVYLSVGILSLASCEAEIAAVMAHELGHVLLHHGSKFGEAYLHLKQGTLQEMRAALEEVREEQEREADEFSIKMLVDAGYDPRAQASFYQSLVHFFEIVGHVPPDWRERERVRRLTALAISYPLPGTSAVCSPLNPL